MKRLGQWLGQFDWAALVGASLCMMFYLGVLGPVIINSPVLFSHSQEQQTDPAEYSQKNANVPAAQGGDQALASYTLWLVIFTAMLAASTIGLWLVTAKTLRHAKNEAWMNARNMRASISAANVSAQAAVDALTHARESSERELRAYVMHFSADLFYAGNLPKNPKVNWTEQAAVSLVIKNEGLTPAYKLKHWAYVDVAPITDESRMCVIPGPALAIRPLMLGRNGSATAYRWLNRPISPEERAGIGSGTHAIYAYGRIEYIDAFGKPRWTNYKLSYNNASWPPLGKNPMAMNFCSDGNDAD